MAKPKSGKNGTDAAPDRFKTKVGREDGDGWAKKEPGNIIQGRVLGRYEFRGNDGKLRAFYQIKLQEPCKATTKNEDDEDKYDEVTLIADQIVNLDEVSRLSDLADHCRDGGVCDVWLKFVGKKARKGSQNTPWVFEGPFVDVIQPPKRVKEDAPF